MQARKILRHFHILCYADKPKRFLGGLLTGALLSSFCCKAYLSCVGVNPQLGLLQYNYVPILHSHPLLKRHLPSPLIRPRYHLVHRSKIQQPLRHRRQCSGMLSPPPPDFILPCLSDAKTHQTTQVSIPCIMMGTLLNDSRPLSSPRCWSGFLQGLKLPIPPHTNCPPILAMSLPSISTFTPRLLCLSSRPRETSPRAYLSPSSCISPAHNFTVSVSS